MCTLSNDPQDTGSSTCQNDSLWHNDAKVDQETDKVDGQESCGAECNSCQTGNQVGDDNGENHEEEEEGREACKDHVGDGDGLVCFCGHGTDLVDGFETVVLNCG